MDWIGSLSSWIGLDWILQNGPMSNSALYRAKLCGEDLSRYLNKIKSSGLRKCPY